MATPGSVAPKFDSFDQELKTECMEGHWIRAPKEEEERTYGLEPHPRVEPFLWKWEVIHRQLKKAGEIHGLEGMADRRTLRLINPAFTNDKVRRNRTTTHTMQMSVQLLKPGELASSHRHNFAAFRFIVEGAGAYTVVDGEKFTMEPGDLILNPPGHWHGHGNDAEPMIWLDGLDYPLVHMLQTTTWEAFPGDFQNIVPDYESSRHRTGHVRPTWEKPDSARGALCFKWNETYETLQALKGSEGCPYNGISLEYVNPITGGSALPTMGCEVALLREGEKTKPHRHRHTVIYHAFRGEGTTVIDGKEFKWSQGDCFVVPLWAAHRHENRSKTNEAILFSMTDKPLMQALKLWKEEPVAA